MALNTQLSDASVNAAVNALLARASGGTLKIYQGAQPANANTAIGAQTLLATIALGNPAFGNAAGGAANLNATAAATAVTTGTAQFFRIFASDSSVVLDGSIGTAGCNINMGSVNIQAGAQVAITGYTYSIAEAGN